MTQHSAITDPFRHPIKGFEGAEVDATPIKNASGVYEWISADRRLNTQLQDRDNTTTALEVMSTYTMPANTFKEPGEMVRIITWGRYLSSVLSKVISLDYGGTQLITNLVTTTIQDTDWKCIADLYFEGSVLQRCSAAFYVDQNVVIINNTKPLKDETAAQVIDLTFNCAAVGICRFEGWAIQKFGGMPYTP